MAGKISEYIEIATKRATDLIDMTVLEGGVLVTRSISALNFFKPRTKTLPFAQPQITINFGFETTATVNITGDTTIFIGTYDNGGVYQLILMPDATPRTVMLGSSFGINLESENTTIVLYPNRPYVIKIYVSHSGQVTNTIERWQAVLPDTLSGTNEVVFKTMFGYYTRTLTSLKAWIKSGLLASEVTNDSTKVTGTTVKDVFDNAEEAVLATSVIDGDYFAGMRLEDTGVTTETKNKYWTAETMKAYFATSGALITYVATAGELNAALAAEKETAQICLTQSFTSNDPLNIYAGNIWITGRKTTFNPVLFMPNSTSSRDITRVYFDAAVDMKGDSGTGVITIAATSGKWYFTFRNLSQDMPVRFSALSGSEIHFVTGNTINIDTAGSTGTYTVTHDSTLDLGQDDVRLDGSNVFDIGAGVDANTPVLIKANTGFVTLATVQKLSEQALLYNRRALVVTIDRKVGDPTMYDLCDILIGWEIEYIDIVRKDNHGGQDYLIFACEDRGGNFIDISSAVGVQSTPNRITRLHYLSSFPSTELYDFYKLDMIFINNYTTPKKLRVRVGGGYWDVSTLEFRVVIKRTL